MTSSNPCPVCKETLTNPAPGFCPRCGWELQTDITFAPALDLPDAVVAAYGQRLAVARRVWREREEMRAALERERQEKAAGDERLAKIEAMQAELMKALEKTRREKAALAEQQQARQRAAREKAAPKRPPAPLKPAATYSPDTPVPELTRDPFETADEFKHRIDALPPVPAGKGELIKEQYDIETGRFPLFLDWADWVVNMPANAHVTVDRDLARAIWENGNTHVLYAHLKARGDAAVIEKGELVDGHRVFPIHMRRPEDDGATEWTEPVTGMVLVRVPGGRFDMGDVFGDGEDWEKPVHRVTLDDFFIGKYPVTQWQYRQVTGQNPSSFKKSEDHPVENVSWNDAQKFIARLTELNNGKFAFRLPSEAQWEYAARSGGRKERYAGGNDVDAVAWYSENSNGCHHPVGKKAPNGLGLHDMSGNVWEWCEDIYSKSAYEKH